MMPCIFYTPERYFGWTSGKKTNPNCDCQFPKYCPACYIPPFLPRMENSTLSTNGEGNVARDQQGLIPMQYAILSDVN